MKKEAILFLAWLIACGTVEQIFDSPLALAMFITAFVVMIIAAAVPGKEGKRSVTRRGNFTRVRPDLSGNVYKHIA